MNLVFVGNYPPRQCGIATFTQHIADGIKQAAKKRKEPVNTSVVAVNDREGYEYPTEVIRTISQHERKDYIKTAEYLNRADVDAVVLQHEFGIFGGEAGEHILSFAERLRKPLVVTLHTVLRQPNDQQRLVIQRLGAMSQRLIVMSQLAVRMLHQVYRIPVDRISCIEHGSPSYDYSRRDQARELLGLGARNTLLTFGHLGRGKGIETAIEALPALKAVDPDFLYILLGKTHPHVLAHEGEAYRESLWARVEELGLADNVRFDNKFADEELLGDYLLAADTYILPYPNEAQITSGTLSYAVGAGCAVLSTPFWHAKEILTEGRGLLYGFGDSRQLGAELVALRQNPELQQRLRKAAKAYGQLTTWTMQGRTYLDVLDQVTAGYRKNRGLLRGAQQLPKIDLQHVRRMTDDTGMLQHSSYHLPNRKEGYCLDDNARAIIFCVQALEQGHAPAEIEPLLDNYLALLHFMQKRDGAMHNFVSYDRNYLDKVGSDDSLGRAAWCLGTLLASESVSQDHKDLAWQLYLGLRPHLHSLRSLRSVAYVIMGLAELSKSEQYSENAKPYARELGDFLVTEYEAVSDGTWNWFENVLTYGNAVLPLSLLELYIMTGETRYHEIAEASTRFLETHTFGDHMIHPIGCHGFMRRGEEPCCFDQQPIDAMGMVMLYTRWYEQTGDEGDLRRATISFEWFMGRNDLGLPLFHAERGSCHDGLMERGINQNQGAESTLAFWISRNRVASAMSRATSQAGAKPGAQWIRSTSDKELQRQLDEVARELPDRSEAA